LPWQNSGLPAWLTGKITATKERAGLETLQRDRSQQLRNYFYLTNASAVKKPEGLTN
jgi:hypothetical protein